MKTKEEVLKGYTKLDCHKIDNGFPAYYSEVYEKTDGDFRIKLGILKEHTFTDKLQVPEDMVGMTIVDSLDINVSCGGCYSNFRLLSNIFMEYINNIVNDLKKEVLRDAENCRL